jgi:hypothetical protein
MGGGGARILSNNTIPCSLWLGFPPLTREIRVQFPTWEHNARALHIFPLLHFQFEGGRRRGRGDEAARRAALRVSYVREDAAVLMLECSSLLLRACEEAGPYWKTESALARRGASRAALPSSRRSAPLPTLSSSPPRVVWACSLFLEERWGASRRAGAQARLARLARCRGRAGRSVPPPLSQGPPACLSARMLCIVVIGWRGHAN